MSISRLPGPICTVLRATRIAPSTLPRWCPARPGSVGLTTPSDPTATGIIVDARVLEEGTWDIVSDRRIASLHPKIRNLATRFVNQADVKLQIKLRVTSALRTFEEQDALYAQGRTNKPGHIVTNAKGGQSIHNFGLALDVVEIKDGQALWNNQKWTDIGSLGKSLGFEWGGDWTSFPDRPHFEKTFGYSLADLQRLFSDNRTFEGYVAI